MDKAARVVHFRVHCFKKLQHNGYFALLYVRANSENTLILEEGEKLFFFKKKNTHYCLTPLFFGPPFFFNRFPYCLCGDILFATSNLQLTRNHHARIRRQTVLGRQI